MTSQGTRLTIEKVVGRGLGLAHGGGATWLISGALPGETVEVEETGRRAGVVEGVVLGVLHGAHPARLAEPCPHSHQCGGCDWPHVDPEAGAPLKIMAASEAARTHAPLAARLSQSKIRTSAPAYRLRARLHWDPETATLGFYGRRSWRVSAIDSCRILSPGLMAALPALSESLRKRCAVAADLEWLENLDGSTRVAALRPARSGPREIDPEAISSPHEMADTVHGFHLLSSNGRLTPSWGPTSVVMALPTPLQVPIGGFFQGNRHLVPWLFDRVRELVGPDRPPTFDLHAGVGFLAAAAGAAQARDLVLVEPFRPSARAAELNLPDAKVYTGCTAEAYLARRHELPRNALVLTDPPRSGMTRDLRRRFARWRPRRILMLACDPATWARDTAFLIECGYRMSHLELIDLFPSTHHVEILATLESE